LHRWGIGAELGSTSVFTTIKTTALSPDEIPKGNWSSFDGKDWVDEVIVVRNMDAYIVAAQATGP
jgi:hypothetical protein